MFDREVGNAASGIQLLRADDRFGGTYINARSTSTTSVFYRIVIRFERNVCQDLSEKEERSCFLV